jgi:hypothetical protein
MLGLPQLEPIFYARAASAHLVLSQRLMITQHQWEKHHIREDQSPMNVLESSKDAVMFPNGQEIDTATSNSRVVKIGRDSGGWRHNLNY